MFDCPLEKKRVALSELETAHRLLIASHGELQQILAGQGRDALGFGGAGDVLLPGVDRSRTQAAGAQLTQAQMHVNAALFALGHTRAPSAEAAQLQLPSALADTLGGLFDFLLLAPMSANLSVTRDAARRVESLYDQVRREALSLNARALPSLDENDDDDDTAFERFATRYLGGHPRFWGPSRWVLLVLVGAGALVYGSFYVRSLVAR